MRDPVLVVALSGWVDAGSAGVSAAALLREQLTSARSFARYELDDLLDFQQTRPMVQLVDGVTRNIVWPVIEIVAGRAGADVVLLVGPEPSLRWPTITREVVDLATRLGVRLAVGLGAMPAVVSHRRPASVLSTAATEALARESGAMRTDYQGPVGLQTVLQVALGDAGIPSLSLWAQVPHYLAGNPSPPAVHALLTRVQEIAGIVTDRSSLEEQCREYTEKVEEGLADRPDVAELVRAIEAEPPDLPSGDELASEIERYLREQ
jgi:predicted ATP-grasp superfamily ATP-dependent carboligase